MAEFAYTTVTGKIKPLLEKIREVGIPPKATNPWLKSVGFKSSNDSSLLGVLKQVGLVDASGVPKPTWNQYRGARHREVLGAAIREGYAEMYAVYADAHARSTADLENVISTSSTGGKSVIALTVRTFKALCEAADFPAQSDLQMNIPGPLHTPISPAGPAQATPPQSRGGPSVHIDIQVHISPEADAKQIDQIFESMAKHLYGKTAGE